MGGRSLLEVGRRTPLGTPSALTVKLLAALGLAAGLAGCNPAGYPDCFRVQCPSPPFYHASYVGYVPAHEGGYQPALPAFGEPPWDDPFADYTQRILTVSPGAGNAGASNTALQTATPWPRYSNNTNIPGNGARMVSAVQHFENGTGQQLPSAGGGGGGAPAAGGGGSMGGGQ